MGLCITAEPRGLYFELLGYYEQTKRHVSETVIGSSCEIADTARIAPYNVRIGDRVRIQDYVIIEEGTTIGSDTIIQPGCVIGAQGFTLYSFQGRMKQAWHGGQVQIGDNVLICNNSIIGRAMYSYGVTKIEDGVHIGHRVGIAHNSIIGKRAGIYSGTSLAGYVTVGENANLYVGVSVANGKAIGAGATVNIGG